MFSLPTNLAHNPSFPTWRVQLNQHLGDLAKTGRHIHKQKQQRALKACMIGEGTLVKQASSCCILKPQLRTWNKIFALAWLEALDGGPDSLQTIVSQSQLPQRQRLDHFSGQQAYEPLACYKNGYFSSRHTHMETAHLHPEESSSNATQSTLEDKKREAKSMVY